MLSNLTKAKTLEYLAPKLTEFVVPKSLSFTVSDFERDSSALCREVERVFGGSTVVVRSSAIDEDGSVNTLAGEYESVLGVSSGELNSISKAVNLVVDSYTQKENNDRNNEILVQKMISDISMSGVIFTHDLNTGAPYYVINYDDISGLTDTVTSGDSEHSNRTLYVCRDKLHFLNSERFQALLKAVRELENIIGSDFLDIEFALGEDLVPYLLQVRAITTQSIWNSTFSSSNFKDGLSSVEHILRECFKKTEGVLGSTTVLGQMPDWNPAEMIGRAPRALALSLYKKLITNQTWSISRGMMGYMEPKGHPLMMSLLGQPFIDTRLSFNSYLPIDLSLDIAERLVDTWVDRLKKNPELHDKVEFDVAITTYSFDIDQKLEELVGNAISQLEKEEFKAKLHKQTEKLIIGDGDYGVSRALEQIDLLSKIHAQASDYGDNDLSLSLMIKDCIELGTIPFSILARHGFIAQTLLLSLGRCGILSEHDIHCIQSSIKTVAGEFVDDMQYFGLGSISKETFMEKYGHLRPGTYDILSHRYDQMENLNPSIDSPAAGGYGLDKFHLSSQTLEKIDTLLDQEGFDNITASQLMTYIESAIQGREYSKFVFTRSVSDILERIAQIGESLHLTRDHLSHIPVDIFLDAIEDDCPDTRKSLMRIAEIEKSNHEISVAIRLPQILSDAAGA